MKYILFILLLTNLGWAEENITNPLKIDWIKNNDGFVWPLPQSNLNQISPKNRNFKELPLSLQEAIKSYWSDDVPLTEIEILEIDLNLDGTTEVFFAIPEYSGTGGRYYQILTFENNRYQDIGQLLGIFNFLELKNGWVQIEVVSKSSVSSLTRTLLSIKDQKYQAIRIEFHDLNSNELRVEKLEDVETKIISPKKSLGSK